MKQAVVWVEAGAGWRAARTRRSLVAAGWTCTEARTAGEIAILLRGDTPLWVVRAGAWSPRFTVDVPLSSGTGRPLAALGALREAPTPEGATVVDAAWTHALAHHGGVLDAGLPPDLDVASACLAPPLTARLVEALSRGLTWPHALREALATGARVVRVPDLDVCDDPRVRAGLFTTSLQRGGAERVVLELGRRLARHGIAARIALLGSPTRVAFAAPPGTLDLGGAGDRALRVARASGTLTAWGADVLHAHLLEAGDLRALAAEGWPVAVTVHNARAGWPVGLETLQPEEASLLVGCARAVEDELSAILPRARTRTVWNGIDVRASAGAPPNEWRARLGLLATDLVLLALANPRPQKRLERLPAVLRAVRARLAAAGDGRAAHLVIAGSASARLAAAQASLQALHDAIAREGVAGSVHCVGDVEEVAPLLSACDVLVSPSAYEGLSLAHLEALAAGRTVVATDVGGTAEIAARTAGLVLVPEDADAETYAEAILRAPSAPAVRTLEDFDAERMAFGYARLYRRVLAPRGGGRGLLLVTNNFSTGGAQTSARRLLVALAGRGREVSAAVLQEQSAFPTPGRTALQGAGIVVDALPRAGDVDAAVTVDALLEIVDTRRPAAVVLWNVIPEHKVLLADALLDTPLYDVSPGGMWFDSLERFFARPRTGLAYRSARDYGRRLAGVIVKYGAEAERARTLVGAPVHVIPNGVPLGDEPTARAEGGPLRFGTAARVEPRKRLEQLLEALRLATPRLPAHVLQVAGGTETGAEDYAADLRRASEGLSVDWLGELPDTGAFLRALDVFTLVAEPPGCPNASLEAMAAGCAVVATDVGGMAEQVEDGVCGLLVPAADAHALADALVDLAHAPTRRRAFGSAARARVAERFAVERMVADYERVLGL